MSAIDELKKRLEYAKSVKVALSEEEKQELALHAELDTERGRVREELARKRNLTVARECAAAREKWGDRFRCIDFEKTTPGLGVWLIEPNKNASAAFRKTASEGSKISDEDARNNVVMHVRAIVTQRSDGECETLTGEAARAAAQKFFDEYTFADGQCQIAIVELNGMTADAAVKKS